MNQLASAHQAAGRALELQVRARRLMEELGFEPAGVVDVLDDPHDPTYRIAFGYLSRAGGGVRHRYIEVPVTMEEYGTMAESSQLRILLDLQRRLEELREAGTTS